MQRSVNSAFVCLHIFVEEENKKCRKKEEMQAHEKQEAQLQQRQRAMRM